MTDTIATPDGVQPGHPSGTPVDGRLGTLARWLSPRTRVLLFAALLAAIGGVLLSWTPLPTQTPDRAWALPWFALVVAFGIAEATALHVEIRKESHSLSLSGIPMMFGLLFVSPLALSLAYLCGAAPAMLFVRKSDVVKTTWNLCLFFAEAALAAFILRHLLGLAMPSSLVEWMVPLVVGAGGRVAQLGRPSPWSSWWSTSGSVRVCSPMSASRRSSRRLPERSP